MCLFSDGSESDWAPIEPLSKNFDQAGKDLYVEMIGGKMIDAIKWEKIGDSTLKLTRGMIDHPETWRHTYVNLNHVVTIQVIH